jgi:hypothetical protein
MNPTEKPENPKATTSSAFSRTPISSQPLKGYSSVYALRAPGVRSTSLTGSRVLGRAYGYSLAKK